MRGGEVACPHATRRPRRIQRAGPAGPKDWPAWRDRLRAIPSCDAWRTHPDDGPRLYVVCLYGVEWTVSTMAEVKSAVLRAEQIERDRMEW
ncbi:hypothetical protein [Variovorax sp. JS1663]|uniref:hypothetical protein n=1 Tax=Variovorax sp. JS1663 TaxID=1851577 RepID=UPI000B6756C9|nr:hypothetical protein [Variovorax sp. JS1663]OUM01650.1 hypothetical protein A8M77_15365 [Variovorax sp. JS1663]